MMPSLSSLRRFYVFGLSALATAVAAFGATAACATNEQYQITAQSCSPYIVGGCSVQTSTTPDPNGVGVGGAFGFASGYDGGFALAAATFAPGGAPVLTAGRYITSVVASMTYTFQVQGAPDTLVPLHMIAHTSASAVHMTDPDGHVAHLVDHSSDPAPNPQFKIASSSDVGIGATRMTTNPVNGAHASAEAHYDPRSGYYCNGCAGSGDGFDTTIWVYSNSDIVVQLSASALVQYDALGDGLDPLPTFGVVSGETDPVFSIDDPAFAAFSIVGVPTGFPPPDAGGSAVPEPASWAMMAAGFGLAGTAMRTRRRAVLSS